MDAAPDKCYFVSTAEDCAPNGNFNFLTTYYCDFRGTFGDSGKIYAFIPFSVLLMVILMYLLASTADDYLSPSLEFMTIKFGLSESLAGVTLLAFGNGAPDVFSAISAVSNSNPDDKQSTLLSISALTGSALFISTVVVLLSTRASLPSKEIQVTPIFFIRDLVFYIMVCVYLLIIMLFLGEINIFVAVGYLVIYATFVILVVVQSKIHSVDNPNESKE